MAVQIHSTMFVHPGPWLRRNIVDHFDLSVTEVAERLRVTRQAMSNLLNGNAGLSADMAIRFEKAFGLSAETMMRMQAAHELAKARAHEDEIKVERVAA
jgi:addiction module HigA family antidote